MLLSEFLEVLVLFIPLGGVDHASLGVHLAYSNIVLLLSMLSMRLLWYGCCNYCVVGAIIKARQDTNTAASIVSMKKMMMRHGSGISVYVHLLMMMV